jgi:hypothetical protein
MQTHEGRSAAEYRDVKHVNGSGPGHIVGAQEQLFLKPPGSNQAVTEWSLQGELAMLALW